MGSIFGPVRHTSVNIAHSIFNENRPRFNVNSNGSFTVNSPLVPCVLFCVDVKPMGVLELFHDQPNLTWEHVNNIPSRPLTTITKGPEYAVTRNFTISVRTDMD